MSHLELNQSSISALVNEFYAEVRKDEYLNPVFEKVIMGNWEPHLARMVEFWSTVLLGTKQFQGNVYGKHMLLNGVEPEHFRRWLGLFEETARRLFEQPVAGEICIVAQRIAGSLQYGFFGEVLVQ